MVGQGQASGCGSRVRACKDHTRLRVRGRYFFVVNELAYIENSSEEAFEEGQAHEGGKLSQQHCRTRLELCRRHRLVMGLHMKGASVLVAQCAQ